MSDIAKKLQAPFPQDEIEFRVQSCGLSAKGKPWVRVLAYVQARAIQRRLDDVFGWDGWTEEYRSTEGNMICRLGVRTEDGWIYKENGASETDIEGFKGGISGALKRVAASGYGIGRYLYDLTESFAECTTEKPSWNDMKDYKKAKTKDGKTFIYWKVPQLPDWALPGNYEKPQPPTLEEVIGGWVNLGGTLEQFDNKIKEQWNLTDREKLQSSHLIGLKKLIESRKQKEGKAS